jgi:hypothetical protein
MRRIYKKSSGVHVWLGDEADDSSTAMDILATLAAPPTHAPGEKTVQYPSFTDVDVARHWKALKAFFKRQWWERVWIRQEIALHYNISVSCGNKTFDMGLIGPALHMLDYVKSLGYEPFEAMKDGDNDDVTVPWDTHPRKLVDLQKSTNSGYTWVGLSHLLIKARGCKATDARDFVFSVLGLADPEVYPIVPSYRDDMRTILVTAAGAAVQQESGLDLFGACQNPERKHGFPSWVPNLAEDWKVTPFSLYDEHRTRGLLLELRVTNDDEPDVKINGETLIIRGGLIDTVRLICEDTVKKGANPEELEAVFATWKKFIRDTKKARCMDEDEGYQYTEEPEPERTKIWLSFLSVLQDDAEDLYPQKRKNKKTRTAFADPDPSTDPYNHLGLNYKLGRAYLLPPTYTTANLHRNRRVHNALLMNCIGRRLGVTKRGFIALLPAEATLEDPIAIFQGASMPYILRKTGHGGDHVLVGEAFIPSYAHGGGETVATDEEHGGDENALKNWIRVC